MVTRKIAYLGPEKTFTEKAARAVFPDGELVPILPVRNVVMAVENSIVECGVVPIENLYNGHVIHTLDSLTKSRGVRIIRETFSEIVHCFGALNGHGEIKTVYSKDQALDQCEDYICANHLRAQTIQMASTAGAAEYVAKQGLLDAAVIASREALLKSGLEVLAVDICPHNRTRFVVLGREETQPTGDDKTILAIHPHLKDRPGILANCTNIFGSQFINLEDMYSRPDRMKGHFFYFELDGHEYDENVVNALTSLRYSLDPKHDHEDTIKILGSFPNSHWND